MTYESSRATIMEINFRIAEEEDAMNRRAVRLLAVAIVVVGMPTMALWAEGSQEGEGTTVLWFNTLFHGGDAKAMEILVQKFTLRVQPRNVLK